MNVYQYDSSSTSNLLPSLGMLEGWFAMWGVAKLDKILIERIRGTKKVAEMAKQVEERRVKWYGLVIRREEHCVGRMAMKMKAHGREERGKPNSRLLERVRYEIKGLSAGGGMCSFSVRLTGIIVQWQCMNARLIGHYNICLGPTILTTIRAVCKWVFKIWRKSPRAFVIPLQSSRKFVYA